MMDTKKRINEEEREEIAKRLRGEGYTLSEIGGELGISKSSVQKILEKIEERERSAELERRERGLDERERRIIQREEEIEEKERISDEKIAKIFRDAKIELKKTREKKEEYEERIGEIEKREKEAEKLFNLLGELKLTLQDVVDVAQNYKSYTEERKRLKKTIPRLREEYEREKKSRDGMRSEHSKAQKELDKIQNEISPMKKEKYSLSNAVKALQEKKDVLFYQTDDLKKRAKYLDEEYVKEFLERKLKLKDIKSETDWQKSSLDSIKNDYDRIKKDYDDLLSSWKSRIDEDTKRYREEELSKVDKELGERKAEIDRDLKSKERESKKLDEIIASKREEANALINKVKELMDVYLGLRERILMNIERCDSIEDAREFKNILINLGKALAGIIKPKQAPLSPSPEPDARVEVRKVVLDRLRKKGIATPVDLESNDHQPALPAKPAKCGRATESARAVDGRPVLLAQPIPKTVIAQTIPTPKEVNQAVPEGKVMIESEEKKKEVQKGKSKERMRSPKKSRRSQKRKMAKRRSSGLARKRWYPTRICPLLTM
jgi:predicted transcriptional regulator